MTVFAVREVRQRGLISNKLEVVLQKKGHGCLGMVGSA
jgi:hypothetical protein